MNFEEFCNEISESIYGYLYNYDIESVKIEKVSKNNGIECTGVVIVLSGENVAPNIYLDYYFMLYKQGKSLDDILIMISEEYMRARVTMEKSNFDIDIDGLRNNAIIKLVNYERNKEKLVDCPHIMFLDLAITFRFLVKLDDSGIASAMITNKDLNNWNITQEELYELAKENTMRLFPAQIRCMDEFIPNMDEICPNISDRSKLYVLTNTAGINGATCMLYQEVIRDFAKEKENNMFILPSSIHEVILLCCDTLDKEGLQDMVKDVNKYIVSEMDYLSDNVYLYSLETDKITI